MRPSKGFLYFGLTILFFLACQEISFSDTNLPPNQSTGSFGLVVEQSLSVGENITAQEHPAQKTTLASTEDRKNLSDALNGSTVKADQSIHQASESRESKIEIKEERQETNIVNGSLITTRQSSLVELPVSHNPSLQDEEYDVPITVNKAVEKNMDLFKYSLSEKFNNWLNRSGRYRSLMKEIFQEKGLPQDLVYLALIESGFNPYAYSWAKAAGPWQFISATAKRYGLKVNWWVDERRDPVKSTIAAAEYLKDLYDLFGSWNLAMAAYNAGEKRVLSGLRKIRGGDFWDLRDTRYIKRETKEYVPRYMAATIIAKNPEAHGFIVDYHEPFQYEEVMVDSPIDLEVIARCAGATLDTIKDLNPELRRWCTPPDQPTYTIRIPAGTKETFMANLESIPENERFTGRTYRVRAGDTLNTIAKNFGVSKKVIIVVNSLGKRYKTRPGDILLIPAVERPIPVAKAEKKETTRENIDKQKRIVYKVKKGDSLYKIAQKHNTSPEKIKKWNGLKNSKLRPGDKLYIFTSLDPPTFF